MFYEKKDNEESEVNPMEIDGVDNNVNVPHQASTEVGEGNRLLLRMKKPKKMTLKSKMMKNQSKEMLKMKMKMKMNHKNN